MGTEELQALVTAWRGRAKHHRDSATFETLAGEGRELSCAETYEKCAQELTVVLEEELAKAAQAEISQKVAELDATEQVSEVVLMLDELEELEAKETPLPRPDFTLTRTVLAAYDAERPNLDLMLEEAEDSEDVRLALEAEKEAVDTVRRAFLEDTKDRNNWSQVKCCAVSDIRKMVDRA